MVYKQVSEPSEVLQKDTRYVVIELINKLVQLSKNLKTINSEYQLRRAKSMAAVFAVVAINRLMVLSRLLAEK